MRRRFADTRKRHRPAGLRVCHYALIQTMDINLICRTGCGYLPALDRSRSAPEAKDLLVKGRLRPVVVFARKISDPQTPISSATRKPTEFDGPAVVGR